ncbi:MAG TPA: hypothetical protein VM532_12495 [Burkholderiales bacterium]|nr:hypothetical protein [Burkholderiales bacterium]
MLDLTPPNLLNQTSLPFRDARGCKEWLATLPLTDVTRAHNALGEVIDSLNLTELPGFERLKIMELLRDKVAFLQESLVDLFAGKPLPLSNRALDAWESVATLWQAMELGYRYCLRVAANNDAETAKHFPLIIERSLRYTGLQVLYHGLVYRDAPERLLRDLHALFNFAEKRGVAHVNVKDSLDGHRGITTPAQIYVRALLVAASHWSTLTTNELAAADMLLKKWASKVIISRIPPEGAPAVFRCTDLAKPVGLWAPTGRPAEGGTLIFLDLKELADSLRRRIRKLSAGASWSELNLPPIFAQVPVTSLLNHLYQAWCETMPAEARLQPVREDCEVASGSFDIFYHCLAGKPFEPPRHTEDVGGLEAQQLAVFGRVTGKVSLETSKEPIPSEAWKLEGVSSTEVALRRASNSKISLSLQQLIAYRKPGQSNYAFGVIRGLKDHGAEGLVAEVLSFADRPEPVTFRSKDAAFTPAVKMKSVEGANVSLLLPLGVYQHGKVLEVRAEVIHMYRLTGLTRHGANFDWVSCEPL